MNINRVNLERHGELQYGNKPNKIILHHADMNGSVEDVNQVHLNNGWTMIGYNYYIRKNGEIDAGRPVDAIGAHCYGQNATSIGICFEGNFMTDTMSDAQYNSGIELCKYLMQQYPAVKEINGHKHYYNTDCPGANFPLDKMINASITTAPAATPVSAPAGTNLLKLWSTGSAVQDLQAKLNKLGYGLSTDGIFGPNTYNAVEHFQASKRLTVDGIVGPETLAALDKAITDLNAPDIHTVKYLQHEIGAAEDNIPGPETLSKCPLIRRGSTGSIVKWLQTKLNITADGIFGYQTLTAVQNFQAKHGLTADGIVGPNTWRKLLGL